MESDVRDTVFLALVPASGDAGSPAANGSSTSRFRPPTSTSPFPPRSKLCRKSPRQSGKLEVVQTEDVSLLSAVGLKNFDAVMFFTTGELPISDSQKRDLLDFVRGGKGFGGVHSATDTFYKWPEYGQLIGAYFQNHPWTQEVTIQGEGSEQPPGGAPGTVVPYQRRDLPGPEFRRGPRARLAHARYQLGEHVRAGNQSGNDGVSAGMDPELRCRVACFTTRWDISIAPGRIRASGR